MVLTAQVL